MEHVRPFSRQDSQAIAELHAKHYFGSKEHATNGIRNYYEKTFFDNPWYDEKFSSLVYCNKKGRIAGFMGRIVRSMVFDGKKITVTVAHRLLVDPDYSSPFAGPLLVRKFLSGEQDMAFSDGANDNARRIWTAAGGSVSLVHSMNWFAPLRPFGFTLAMLGQKKRVPPAMIRAFLPFAGIFDGAFGKVIGWDFKQPPPDTSSEEIDLDSLMDSVDKFTSKHRLKPEYDRQSLEWVYEVLKNNTHRGRFAGNIVRNKSGTQIGVYLYYITPNKNCEVILLAAHPKYREIVLRHLLNRAYIEGAAGVIGRMEPDFLDMFWRNNFFAKKANWTLIHSKNNDLLDVIHRGQAFISALEGELWLHAPDDRL